MVRLFYLLNGLFYFCNENLAVLKNLFTFVLRDLHTDVIVCLQSHRLCLCEKVPHPCLKHTGFYELLTELLDDTLVALG